MNFTSEYTLMAVSIIVHITYIYDMICFILKNIINIPFFIDLFPFSNCSFRLNLILEMYLFN